jgi:2-polyprenyl-3-methyl-5-hydroxy-6-metoxy-1,4-benzoquinol methylase
MSKNSNVSMKQNSTGQHGGPQAKIKEFWNHVFSRQDSSDISLSQFLSERAKSPIDYCYWNLLGSIEGRELLEIGCGIGDDTIRYVQLGARVTSIDISEIAVQRVSERLNAIGLTADVRVMDAFEVQTLEKRFDMVVGRFILHHLEPFDELAALLASCLNPEGHIVFIENNGHNPLLLFARKYISGRYGIPKYGDEYEHPLMPDEVAMLSTYFEKVECHFPQLIFLRLISTYIFRHKSLFQPVMRMLDRLDDLLWVAFPRIRSWSYYQVVEARNPRIR